MDSNKDILYDKEVKVEGLHPLKMSNFIGVTSSDHMSLRMLAAYLISAYDRIDELEKQVEELRGIIKKKEVDTGGRNRNRYVKRKKQTQKTS